MRYESRNEIGRSRRLLSKKVRGGIRKNGKEGENGSHWLFAVRRNGRDDGFENFEERVEIVFIVIEIEAHTDGRIDAEFGGERLGTMISGTDANVAVGEPFGQIGNVGPFYGKGKNADFLFRINGSDQLHRVSEFRKPRKRFLDERTFQFFYAVVAADGFEILARGQETYGADDVGRSRLEPVRQSGGSEFLFFYPVYGSSAGKSGFDGF